MNSYKYLGALVGLGAALSSSALAAERSSVDRIVAVIEEQIVTERELEKRAKPFLERLKGLDDSAERDKQRREILLKVLEIEIGEKVVDREIKASRETLGVGEAEINRAIEEVLRMNRLTRDQLQAALYGQGMTWSEYREKLRQQIERARLIQMKVQGKIEVRESSVQQRCRERQSSGVTEPMVCASHLLLQVKPGMSPEQVEKLRVKVARFQAELSHGADFAAYALKHSDDKASPDGSLGCFGRGEMVGPFEEAAYATAVGQVSPVIRTQFGFHVIKVTDRRNPAMGGCDTPEELASFRNEIYQEEMEQQMNHWIAQLRKAAFVEIRL